MFLSTLATLNHDQATPKLVPDIITPSQDQRVRKVQVGRENECSALACILSKRCEIPSRRERLYFNAEKGERKLTLLLLYKVEA